MTKGLGYQPRTNNNIKPIAADVVVAVRYGKWKAAWLPNEPYKDDYLVVFDPCRWKHNAWPLRGNINTPNEAWRIVDAIERAVKE